MRAQWCSYLHRIPSLETLNSSRDPVVRTALGLPQGGSVVDFPTCKMGQQQRVPVPREALWSLQPGNASLVGTKSRFLVGTHLPRAGGGGVPAAINR